MRKLFLPALALSMSMACSSSGTRPSTEFSGRNETGQPALHAIQDKQLRELMDRMDALVQERFMTQPELDTERRKFALRISSTAESLRLTLNRIIEYLPSLRLSDSEQLTFLALAQKLSAQTQQLQHQAAMNQIDAIDITARQMNMTCTACHALFRKLDH